MNFKIFLLIWFLGTGHEVFAQFETPTTTPDSEKTSSKRSNKPNPVKTPTNIKEKLIFGGGLDIRFGDFTVIGISPLIGYKVTDKLLPGVTLTYRYFSDNRPGVNYSTSTYGIAPFVRYMIYGGLFAHVEYEALYGEWDYQRDPFWINSFFVGGGYSVPLGNNGFVGIYALWNLTENPNYIIYTNPVIRVSFGVGF